MENVVVQKVVAIEAGVSSLPPIYAHSDAEVEEREERKEVRLPKAS